jgi:hypothetical protein
LFFCHDAEREEGTGLPGDTLRGPIRRLATFRLSTVSMITVAMFESPPES